MANKPENSLRTELRRAVRNIIVLSLDACSAGHFGCHGYGRNTTPHMDAVAARGVRFSRHFCQYPNTGENFRCIMLSRYPDLEHRGIFPVLDKGKDLLLAEYFQRAGFATGAFSGNGFWGPSFGHGPGWDEFIPHPGPTKPPYFGSFQPMCRADSIRTMATDWLDNHQKDRFLLWTHFLEPHDPYHAPEPWTHMFAGDYPDCPGIDLEFELYKMNDFDKERRLPDAATLHYQTAYDGSLAFADSEIGKMIADLKSRGVTENSLIVITADHGEGWGQHGRYIHNNCVYDEEMNIPLIFLLPEKLRHAGIVVDAISESVDILPTLLDAAGVLPDGFGCDGTSLLPALLGETQTVKPYVFGLSGAEVFNKQEELSATRSICTQSHKLIHNALSNTYEFYDVAKDPGETRNLYDENDPKCRELQQELARTIAKWEQRSKRL